MATPTDDLQDLVRACTTVVKSYTVLVWVRIIGYVIVVAGTVGILWYAWRELQAFSAMWT